MRSVILASILAFQFGATAFLCSSAAGDDGVTSRDLKVSGSRVAFSPVGSTLAVAPDGDGKVTFIEVATGKTWTTSTPRSSHGHGGAAKIAFAPDGKLLAAASGSASRGGLAVWRVADGALCGGFASEPEGLKSFALGVAFAPDGKTVLSGSDAVHLWSLNDDGSLQSGPELTPINSGASQPRVSSLAFSPDGLAVAAGNWIRPNRGQADPARPRLNEQWDGRLLLYVSTGKTIAGVPLATPPGNLYDVQFSPDGNWLAALIGTEARAAGGGRLPAGKAARADGARPAAPANSAVMLWSVPPRGIPAARGDKAAPVATLLADVSRRADYLVREYMPEPDGLGEALALSAFGVISAGDGLRVEDGVLKVTNLTTINQFAGRAKRSISFAGEPPANWQRKKPEILFETHFSKAIAKPDIVLPLNGLMTCLAFSPDGATIATGSDDTKVRLWSVRSKRVTQTLEAHTAAIQSLAFSADGRLLASAGGGVKIWQLAEAPKVASMPEEESKPGEPSTDVPETRKMSRTWTDVTGKFKVKASLVGVRNGNVTLKKEDGGTISVPVSKLSDDDREFLTRTKPNPQKRKKKKKKLAE